MSAPAIERDARQASPTPPRERRRAAGPSRRLVWSARGLIVLVLVGGWQLAASTSPALESVASSPGRVIARLGTEFGSGGGWWAALAITLQEAVLGFLLGLVVAVVMVSIIVPSPLLARFVAPFIAVANALPIVVLVPMFILWFGISLQSKVYFVATAIFFIIFHGLYTGIRAIDSVLLDNARALGAGRLDLVRQVYAPAVLTWIIAGLRLSAAWALLAAVVTEYLGSNEGIGFEVASAQQLLDPDGVIAGIIAVAVVAVILDRAFVRIEARYSRWRVF